MTKLRAPLTFENALARIAGVVGWDAVAEIGGRADRTVRDWGDPSVPRSPPIAVCVALDRAFQQANGVGKPMFETYALLVEADDAEFYSCTHALQRTTAEVLKETGDLGVALTLATLPGADDDDLADVEREGEEVISKVTEALRQVRSRRRAARAPP